MVDERLVPDVEDIPEDDEAEPEDAGIEHDQPDPEDEDGDSDD